MSIDSERLEKARKKLRPDEPIFEGKEIVEGDSRLSNAYNWYRDKCDRSDMIGWMIDYLEDEDREDDANIIRSLKASAVSTTLCAIARMMFRGIELPQETEDFFEERLELILEANEGKGVAADGAKKASPRAHLAERIHEVLGELEAEVDKHVNDQKYYFKLYEFLKAREFKGVYADHIYAYYFPKFVELIKVKNARKEVKDEEDQDLIEVYRNWSDDRLEAYEWFILNMLEDAKSYSADHPNRKVRKARKKDPMKVIKNVKFLDRDTNLGIISVSPQNIIGADVCWVFNTKYRVLNYYVAKDESGLAIKGTTIRGYDESKTVGKRIRDPQTFLKVILKEGKVASRKAFDALDVTKVIARGRLNEDSLILRVIK